MGIQLEGDGFAAVDVSMHTELEHAVWHAALQYYVALLNWAKGIWEILKTKGEALDPHHAQSLEVALNGIQSVKAAYLLLTSSFKTSNPLDKVNTLLHLGQGLRQLLDMNGKWIQGWKHMLIPFLIQEVSNIKRTLKETGEDTQAHDAIQKMECMQQAIIADQSL